MKIKILFTIPNFDTAGSGKVVYDLVKGLDKNKFSPEIACFHNKGAFLKEVEQLGVPIHIIPFTTSYKPYITFLSRVNRISKFFKKHEFDLIHSWHWSSDFSEVLAAKIARVPYVYTKKAMSWGNKAWRIKSRLSTKILVLNSDMIPRFFSKLKNKTTLIHLGVDLTKYPPQKKIHETPLGLQFKESDFVITTVANLVPIKGIEYLIKAIERLNDPNIKLLVVGNNKNEYGKELMQNTINENIYFIDKQLDVKPYHAISDVFIIPTLPAGEGLPVAPIEAMASQRIIIGSDVEGVNEVLQDYPNCLFPAKNVEAICDKIKEIQQLSINERDTLALQMRKTVEGKFSLLKCISEHEHFYLNLLK